MWRWSTNEHEVIFRVLFLFVVLFCRIKVSENYWKAVRSFSKWRKTVFTFLLLFRKWTFYFRQTEKVFLGNTRVPNPGYPVFPFFRKTLFLRKRLLKAAYFRAFFHFVEKREKVIPKMTLVCFLRKKVSGVLHPSNIGPLQNNPLQFLRSFLRKNFNGIILSPMLAKAKHYTHNFS